MLQEFRALRAWRCTQHRKPLEQAQWGAPEIEDDETALIVGTSKGPIESWMTAPPELAYRTKNIAAYSMGLHEIAESLATEFRLGHGPRLTYSAACASGLHALIHATMLIQSGQARRALVVAAEASVHPLFIGSFRRLGVLPPEGFGCRPFDHDRAGFLMSESAAAICLESADISTPRQSPRILAQFDRFAMGGDATHLTGVDPQRTNAPATVDPGHRQPARRSDPRPRHGHADERSDRTGGHRRFSIHGRPSNLALFTQRRTWPQPGCCGFGLDRAQPAIPSSRNDPA